MSETNLKKLLDDLEAKVKAATPGPWKCSEKSFQGLHDIYCGGELIANATNGKFKDAEHIAACSPETVLALIAALREAREVIERAASSLNFSFEEIGVYPASVIGGENPYTERTPEMNEHNEKVTQLLKDLTEARAFLAKWNKD